jgi:molybdopterin synthase catalytic subunit
MSIASMIDQIKSHPDYSKAGMILCHNGVVRATSREGEEVTGLEIKVDHGRLKEIIIDQKKRQGIVQILVWINEDKPLSVGDDVMYLVVAGDIRETVISTLTDTLNLIKSEVTTKKQYFKG